MWGEAPKKCFVWKIPKICLFLLFYQFIYNIIFLTHNIRYWKKRKKIWIFCQHFKSFQRIGKNNFIALLTFLKICEKSILRTGILSIFCAGTIFHFTVTVWVCLYFLGKINESQEQRPLRRSHSSDDNESEVSCKQKKKNEKQSVLPRRRENVHSKQNRYIPKRRNATPLQ